VVCTMAFSVEVVVIMRCCFYVFTVRVLEEYVGIVLVRVGTVIVGVCVVVETGIEDVVVNCVGINGCTGKRIYNASNG